ncbi:MAG: hypothetical protein E6J84_12105 [Deltaproteobacteria bacterium]|nr:MAG: hypothetical protein E6J84_12105 [Deltaproteobacteria bacterium]
MRRKCLHGGPFVLSLVLLGCGGMKDPASVADKFVDRYYVESDQDGALPLTTGVASLRLKDELKLTREARLGNPGMQLRPVRVYYSRKALTGDDAERVADYELDIRPQGGGTLQRGATVTLSRQQDGTWRVSRFSESQPK